MTELEEARAFFSNDKYAVEVTGIHLDDISKGYAKCSLKLDERHYNAVGQVMGGVYFTLADFVFAAATNYKQPITVTTVSQISYLSTVKGDTLYGESRLLKNGKRNCFYEIHITDNLENLIAIAAVSGTHLNA